MTETWDPAKFEQDMQALMEAKLPISESKIKGLKNKAMAHPKVRRSSPFNSDNSFYELSGWFTSHRNSNMTILSAPLNDSYETRPRITN